MYTDEFKRMIKNRDNCLSTSEILYIAKTSPQLRCFPDIYSSYSVVWCVKDEFGEVYSITEVN